MDVDVDGAFVREHGEFKSLHFSALAVQSRMSLRYPGLLVAEYTRTMMGFLLFHPKPKRLGMIGLGGGSIAKFCHRELTTTRIDVIEINSQVIALRDEFLVPVDGERFTIHHANGAVFLRDRPGEFDVLIVDAYNRRGIPSDLSTLRFYRDCRQALSDSGMLVVNLYNVDHELHERRIRAAFEGGMFAVDGGPAGNRIVFAFAHRTPAWSSPESVPISHYARMTLARDMARVSNAYCLST